jgi:hypothetical protein
LRAQIDQLIVGPALAHQPVAGRFAEGHAELDARHRAHHGLVDALDGLDEVRLPEDDADRLGALDRDRGDLHVCSLRFGRAAAAAHLALSPTVI